MKLAILGYGRMGKEVESMAKSRGHSISAIIDKDNQGALSQLISGSDAAIDFSIPEKAFDLCRAAIDAGIPVVSGTTGWNDQIQELREYIDNKGGTFLHAANFSLGVNIFFHINKLLASVMNEQTDYSASIQEIHHIHKLDAPSGTAIRLADDIVSEIQRYEKWKLGQENGSGTLPVVAKRIDEVPGTHTIEYQSKIDRIQIKHEAYSRKGFAQGAVVAAEYIAGRKGIYTMADVLGIK